MRRKEINTQMRAREERARERESEGVGWKSGNTEESLVMPRKQKIEANSVCMAGYFKCGSRLAEGEGEKKKGE